VITLAEHNSMVLPLDRLIKKGVKLRVIDVGNTYTYLFCASNVLPVLAR